MRILLNPQGAIFWGASEESDWQSPSDARAFQAIESRIVYNLRAISRIVEVHNPEKEWRRTPAVTIWGPTFEQEFATIQEGQETEYTWVLRCWIKVQRNNPADAQSDMKLLLTDILEKFQEDPDLGATCISHLIESGELFYDEANLAIVMELKLTATAIEM